MTYRQWLATVPVDLKEDPLWKMTAYRHALFLQDISWPDVTKLTQDPRTRDLSGQLYDSITSMPANIAEGYSRSTGRDRARFYEYALGSAREARTRYYAARHMISDNVAPHRIALLTEVIRLLTRMVPDQRIRPRIQPTITRPPAS